jgi:cytoskeletal protein CcmA (bactofilin family)
MEARIASEQMEGIIYSNIDGTIEGTIEGTIDSESELSIASRNRF